MNFTHRYITLRKANRYVNKYHRHLDAPQGAIIAIALYRDGEIVGVAMIGRPPARQSDKGTKLEVVRVAVREGVFNGCSYINSRAKRVIQALGCQPITKSLRSESGASMRAAGWKLDGVTGGGTWSRPSRKRKKPVNAEPKLRWSA